MFFSRKVEKTIIFVQHEGYSSNTKRCFFKTKVVLNQPEKVNLTQLFSFIHGFISFYFLLPSLAKKQ